MYPLTPTHSDWDEKELLQNKLHPNGESHEQFQFQSTVPNLRSPLMKQYFSHTKYCLGLE